MIALLQAILCVLKNIVLAIGWAGAQLINGLVVAIGALAAVIVAALPSFPTEATTPSSGVLGALNWVVPMGPLLGVLTTVVGLWLAFLSVKIVLAWVRAL